MDWPIVLLIGIAIGWLVELLVDYFFWRPRRICPETERLSQLRSRHGEEVLRYREDIDELQRSARRYESDLQERIAEIAGLQAKLSVLGETRVDLSWLDKVIGLISPFSGGSGPITVTVGATQLAVLSTMESHLREKGLDIDTFIAAFFSSELWANWPGTDFGGYLLNIYRGGTQSLDDLDLIYGIGSEIEDILYRRGVLTFEQLAKMSLEELIELFQQEGIPLGFFFPESKIKEDKGKRADKWQILEQARLLAKGEHAAWAQVAAEGTYRRKARRLTNLELIWGINSKLEQELYELGITDIAQLAQASVEKIGSVLEKLKGKYGLEDVNQVHTEIKKQAELAIDEEWGQLAGYQRRYSEQWDFDLTKWEIFTEDEKAQIREEYETLGLSRLLEIRWGAEDTIATETREMFFDLKKLVKRERWQYLNELIALGPRGIPADRRRLFRHLVKLAEENEKKEFDELVELVRAGDWDELQQRLPDTG